MKQSFGIIKHSAQNIKLEQHFKDKEIALNNSEILIKVLKAPMNPSDYYTILDKYPMNKKLPYILGFEGYGQIVEVSEDLDKKMIGQKGYFLANSQYGSYSQYSITNKQLFYHNEDNINHQFLVNTITASKLYQRILKEKSNFVLSGANTSVSRLILLLNKLNENLDSLNLYQTNYDKSLQSDKNNTIFVQNDNKEKIAEKIKELKPKVFIDCVGGYGFKTVFENMPDGSIAYIYGALGGQMIKAIDTFDFIFRDKTIKGFYLMKDGQIDETTFKHLQQIFENQNNFQQELVTFSYEDYEKAIEEYPKRGNKKMILEFNKEN